MEGTVTKTGIAPEHIPIVMKYAKNKVFKFRKEILLFKLKKKNLKIKFYLYIRMYRHTDNGPYSLTIEKIIYFFEGGSMDLGSVSG